MNEKIEPKGILFVGCSWILLGLFAAFTRIIDIFETSVFKFSLDFLISSIISIIFLITSVRLSRIGLLVTYSKYK